MEQWRDQAIVLAARSHGENGAVLSVLSEHNGRHAGYVRGAKSSKMRGILERGNLVNVDWQARTTSDLGTFNVEPIGHPAATILDDPLRLAGLVAACRICDESLPEREGHTGLFHGMQAMLQALETENWAVIYVMWEVALLKELGFSLDLQNCAGGGDNSDLAYVSPKTGKAVSRAEGEPYKDRLLPLPDFLNHSVDGGGSNEDILKGLELTGYFFQHWVFAHHTRGIPEDRLRFQERFAKTVGTVNNVEADTA